MLRTSAQWALIALVPSTAIAMHYVRLGARTGDDFVVLISSLAFVATFAGALASLLIARRKVRGMRWLAVLIATAATTIVLLAAIRTLPRWPFADVGLIVSWSLLSAVVTAASIYLAGVGMPNTSFERTRGR
jgi:hypothetical protein